jgi:hypothetical protein
MNPTSLGQTFIPPPHGQKKESRVSPALKVMGSVSAHLAHKLVMRPTSLLLEPHYKHDPSANH